MSIGFFLDDNSPVMWRGPMLHRALEQFLSDVHWGEIDTLLVDMPPGTGDVSSRWASCCRAEVIVVTTPQPAAQQVAVRAAQMREGRNARDRSRREHVVPRRDRPGDLRLGVESGSPRRRNTVARTLFRSSVLRELRTQDAVREVAPESEAALAIDALAVRVQSARAGQIRKALTVIS